MPGHSISTEAAANAVLKGRLTNRYGGVAAYEYEGDTVFVPTETEAEILSQALSALIEAAAPFADHDWYDAGLEDDNCKLVRHSGSITVGHWRRLVRALNDARAAQPRS